MRSHNLLQSRTNTNHSSNVTKDTLAGLADWLVPHVRHISAANCVDATGDTNEAPRIRHCLLFLIYHRLLQTNKFTCKVYFFLHIFIHAKMFAIYL